MDATPTMFINGQKLDGAVPAEDVRLALDQALKDAGVAPPEHKKLEFRFVIEKPAIAGPKLPIANCFFELTRKWWRRRRGGEKKLEKS